MANEINNIKDVGTVISKTAAGAFVDNCQFLKSIDKEDHAILDGANGYMSGDSFSISKPFRPTTGKGADISSTIQDVKEEKVTVTLTDDDRYHVAVKCTAQEIATEIALKSWLKRIVVPSMQSLANNVEAELAEQAKNAVFNRIGTPGSNTYDTDTMLQAGEYLDYGMAPSGDRYALLNPLANRKAVNARKGQFNHQDEIGKQYKLGYMGDADGFSFMRNNLMPTHINGTMGGTPLVAGGSQTGSTIDLDGLAASGTVTKGTTFTLAGVYAVHPITKVTQEYLQEFVVTADATASSGAVTLSIYPDIVTTGSTKTVSAGPADNAAVSFTGTASQNYKCSLAYQKQAFRLISVPLIKPDGVDMVGQATEQGVTVRSVRDYTISDDSLTIRFDVFAKLIPVRPEWASVLPN